MSDGAHHNFYRRLVEAANREVDPQRVDSDRRALMELIAEIFGRDHCAVLLWLADYEISPEREELRLAYVWRGESGADAQPEALRNRRITEVKDPSQSQLSWLTDWYRQVFRGNINITLRWYRLERIGEFIGYICVVSHALAAVLVAANSDPRLRTTLQALADKVVVGRKVRVNVAMKHLQEQLAKAKDQTEIWDAIARTARTYTSAQLALVYRPVGVTKGGRLAVYAADLEGTSLPRETREPLMSTGNSVTWRIFGGKGAVRINDIYDDAHILERFGVKPWSPSRDRLNKILSPAKALVVVSVVAPSMENKENGVLLIKAVNKKAGTYLQNIFSKTDAAIIEKIAEYISIYLPGKLVAEAVSAITHPLQKQSRNNAGMEPVAEQLLDSLVRELAEHVQGVEAIAFQFPGLPPICSNGGHPFKDWNVREQEAGSFQAWRDRWLYIAMVGQEGRMLVLLKQNDLPIFEAEIIRGVGAEMAWLLHEIINYQSAAQRMVEIRHAIRSGVQGVLGNVKPALGKLQLIAKKPTPEIIEREFLKSAQFRKALEKALIAASHASKVLEEGRYAFAGITYNSLRLGGHGLHAMVNEVLAIARIEAELRGVSIEYINNIPNDLDNVVCDRAAMIIVFQNVVENAIKYSFRNTKSSVHLNYSKGNWLFSVTDRGVYIDQSDYEVIFQPFKRVYTHDPAANMGGSRRPGTGLGLSICQRIVEAHDQNARITVQSRRDFPDDAAETTFTISVPRRLSKPPAPEE